MPANPTHGDPLLYLLPALASWPKESIHPSTLTEANAFARAWGIFLASTSEPADKKAPSSSSISSNSSSSSGGPSSDVALSVAEFLGVYALPPGDAKAWAPTLPLDTWVAFARVASQVALNLLSLLRVALTDLSGGGLHDLSRLDSFFPVSVVATCKLTRVFYLFLAGAPSHCFAPFLPDLAPVEAAWAVALDFAQSLQALDVPELSELLPATLEALRLAQPRVGELRETTPQQGKAKSNRQEVARPESRAVGDSGESFSWRDSAGERAGSDASVVQSFAELSLQDFEEID